ncbi:hypothetical protein TIFTF001_045394 [Ficus carica]|uniref:RNase H type-1 domain-containing protein n=1 Tax=Ficus carica TaxID=3494 RepID=A0AA88CLF4_FICCA|nr:hypothetical protein TIFTF001_045391 [Ficus carica]GMN20862.1 hypothetical protein TIFTF001_045394 [Ficus carica]
MDTGWNQALIEEIFWSVDKESILSIPLSARRMEDCLIWYFDSRGAYAVKSGFKVEMEDRWVACGSRRNSKIWRRTLAMLFGYVLQSGRFGCNQPLAVAWNVLRVGRLVPYVFMLQLIAIEMILMSFHKWKAPEHGCVTLNGDVAIDDALGFIGIGVVARDDRGLVLGAVSRRMARLFSPHVGECLAVKEGAWLGLSCGFSKWIFETDALNTFKAV